MSYERLSGVQMWERGQFVTGGSMFSPGGVTVGPTYGPPTMGPAPGGCTEVPGGVVRCVQPPMTERGLDTTPWQQRELNAAERDLQDQGCVPTSRMCPGSPRAPSRAWCCPGGPTGLAPFIGSPYPHGFAGLGALEGRDWFRLAVIGAVGIAGISLLTELVSRRKVVANPSSRTVTGPGGTVQGYAVPGPKGWTAHREDGALISGPHDDRAVAEVAVETDWELRQPQHRKTMPGFVANMQKSLFEGTRQIDAVKFEKADPTHEPGAFHAFTRSDNEYLGMVWPSLQGWSAAYQHVNRMGREIEGETIQRGFSNQAAAGNWLLGKRLQALRPRKVFRP